MNESEMINLKAKNYIIFILGLTLLVQDYNCGVMIRENSRRISKEGEEGDRRERDRERERERGERRDR